MLTSFSDQPVVQGLGRTAPACSPGPVVLRQAARLPARLPSPRTVFRLLRPPAGAIHWVVKRLHFGNSLFARARRMATG